MTQVKLVYYIDNREAVLLLDDILREEKKSKRRDFYKILDVRPDSSQEDIRKSFKKLAHQWHPDKNCETPEMREHAEKMFRDVNEAYNLLTDPRKRKIYDEGGHPDDPNSAFHNSEESTDPFTEYFASQPESRKRSRSRERNYEKKRTDSRDRSRSQDYRKKSKHNVYNKNKNFEKKYK